MDPIKNFNRKVLYRKFGKLFLAYVYVYIAKQPKEGKILKGFHQALKDHMISNNWI